MVNNKGAAYLDGIKWVPILEVGNRANEIETGGVNVVKNPAPQDMDRLKANPDLVITEFPALANYWISTQPREHRRSASTTCACARRSRTPSIARASAQSLYFGHAAATYGPIAPNYKWYDNGVEQFNQFDLDKAKSLLEEAGWTEGSAASARRPARSSPGSTSTTAASRPRRRSTRPSSPCSRTSASR